MKRDVPFALGGAILVAVAAACGGGSTGSAPAPTMGVTSPPPVVTPQVVSIAIPTGAIGVENDPTFGTVSGFTQQVFSQVLGFPPGAQIMVRSSDPDENIPHTFSVISMTGFIPNAILSTSPTGGSTVTSGFSSGTIGPGALAGPFTLAAGVYFIGCAFHYVSNGMRTVLVVAANATPGPQATPNPANTPEPLPSGGFVY